MVLFDLWDRSESPLDDYDESFFFSMVGWLRGWLASGSTAVHSTIT